MVHYPEFTSFIDWELLKSPLEICTIKDSPHILQGEQQVIVERDSEYNLKGTLFSKNTNILNLLPRNNQPAGSIYHGFQVQGTTKDHAAVILESCRIRDINTTNNNPTFNIMANLKFNKLSIKYSEKKVTRLREWYLNGPNNASIIDSKDPTSLHQCSKEQLLLSDSSIQSQTFGPNYYSDHYIWGKNKDYKFLLARVPVEGPKWSTNIQIEYHIDWGGIPSNNERQKIEELCSFVFGKHLLSVGHTTYDQTENIIEASVCSPWGYNARFFCAQPEMPPVRLPQYPSGRSEAIINYLLPKFLEVSTPLSLSEALWNYWISGNIPLGPNLPVIGAAIETMVNQWYKWKKSKSQGVYLKTKKFSSLIEPEIENIEHKLAELAVKSEVNTIIEEKYIQSIIKNIKNANQFTFTDRFFKFFNELELKTNAQEIEALKGRHFFVHGHAHFGEVNWEEVIQRVNTLQTTFNKVFLKLLDYESDYIDRSVEGWPDIQLSST
jgi:hypothetical protein